MATAMNRSPCVKCDKQKAIMKCEGCLQTFRYNHMMDHRQELSKKLDDVEVIRDTIRQTLTEQTTEPRKHALIQQIDHWERDSIDKIRQTAEKARQLLLKHTAGHFTKTEAQLNQLTDLLQQSRPNNDFVETDLNHWKDELTRIAEQLANPWNVKIRKDSESLVTKIDIDIVDSGSIIAQNYIPSISIKAKWSQNGTTIAGGNGRGSGLNQLSNPYGLYVDKDQTIYLADYSNHRVMEWKNGATSGRIVAGGNGQGNRTDQLYGPTDVIVDKENDSLIICDKGNQRVLRWPRQNGTSGEIIILNILSWGLAMDNDGDLYVSDCNKHEVRRWKMGETNGAVVAGGNGAGNRRDQLSNPTYLSVDQDHSVYVSDYGNHRVMKWMKGAKEGIVVAGGQGAGNSLTQFSSPYGVVVDQLGTVYVVDYGNNRVMHWPKGATQGTVVAGGNGGGVGTNQFSSPVGITFDRQGNLYVADHSNHRVQKFNIEPSSNS